MKLLRYFASIGLFIAQQFAPALVLAQAVPPVPTDFPIVDQTNTLTTDQIKSLSTTIAEERKNSGNQIAILMISSLNGDSIEDFSIRTTRQWGIGEKDKNNGVLLLIVKDDRQLRIEVGYGLEGVLPDVTASRIIRYSITPAFKQGKYYDGISAGIKDIIAVIHNEYKAPSANSKSINLKNIDWSSILFGLFFLPVWVGSLLARSKSWWGGGVVGGVVGIIISFIFGFLFIGVAAIVILFLLGLLLDWLVSKNYRSSVSSRTSPSWWAGGDFFGGSGSSGGFGGFGGGGFGGGGSSGSW